MHRERSDFHEKLIFLEQEANALAESLPPGISRNRAENIAMVIGLLKARFDLLGPVILPAKTRNERL